MLDFGDVGCDCGNPLRVTCTNGEEYVGMFVGIDIDYDGADGGDSVSLRLGSGEYISFLEGEIARMEPLTHRACRMRVRYVGDYYKVSFEKGREYDVLEVTDDGFCKVYSDAIEDWALLPPQDFEFLGCHAVEE